MSVSGKPQAGWYPDPDGKGGPRYFDGTNWGPKAPTGPAPLTTPPQKKSGRGGKIIAVIVGIVFVLFLIGKCSGSDDKKTDDSAGSSPTSSHTSVAAAPTPTGPTK